MVKILEKNKDGEDGEGGGGEELCKEIDILRDVRHPNVVPYYGTASDESQIWVIYILYQTLFIIACLYLSSHCNIYIYIINILDNNGALCDRIGARFIGGVSAWSYRRRDSGDMLEHVKSTHLFTPIGNHSQRRQSS